jgi:3-oxoacyl-[acyl-carrier protein] reductase
VYVGGDGRLRPALSASLDELGIKHLATHADEATYKGLVFDASGLADSEELVELQRFFTPVLRSLQSCGRVVVLGTPPEHAESAGSRVAQRALEGFTRSLAKEVGRGSTVQLVYVAPRGERAMASTLGFLLSPKSAYVSGQVVRVGRPGEQTPDAPVDWAKPLAGKLALVTGAGRGIGEQITRVLHRDGASIVGVDVAQAASELKAVVDGVDGEMLVLDITAKDAPARIARHARQRGGVDIVVHNAGITRDRKLANMKEDGFATTVAVNLTAPERITAALLEADAIHQNGRIIGIASVSGIAGNVGQTSYAASKAGVIGLVDALADTLPQGITANAVAPGFIETRMTAAVPLMTRELGRRLNSLQQGGQPVDVAETVAWLAAPASAAVNGNVVRVCGQMMMGA